MYTFHIEPTDLEETVFSIYRQEPMGKNFKTILICKGIEHKRALEMVQMYTEIELLSRKREELVKKRSPRAKATGNYRNNNKRLDLTIRKETAELFNSTKALSGLPHDEFIKELLNAYLDKGQAKKETASDAKAGTQPKKPKKKSPQEPQQP